MVYMVSIQAEVHACLGGEEATAQEGQQVNIVQGQGANIV